MGNLREKIFSYSINKALDSLRLEMCRKYKPKKGNRFFTDDITYEIGVGKFVPGGVQLEISSKIPAEIFDKKGVTDKYFKEVKKIMTSKTKKPEDIKMENIVHSTTTNEIKERDYIKCIYIYEDKELFSDDEVDQIISLAKENKVDLDQIKGANTLAGRAVIYASMENMGKLASESVTDLVQTNAETIKKYM